MSNKIQLGPLLGFEDGNIYTVCILLPIGSKAAKLKVSTEANAVAFTKIAEVGQNEFWRAEFPSLAAAGPTTVTYEIVVNGAAVGDPHGRTVWKFYVPGQKDEPLIAYASCNGFSSARLARDTSQPYALWERMGKINKGAPGREGRRALPATPFSLLLMGGDQVYADDIWESKHCPTLQEWSDLNWDEQNKAKVSAKMKKEITAFYDQLYLARWSDENMSLMLASIPSVMMWDDHDIFDGWGSYPEARQECDVYKEIFKQAVRVFDLFQLRASKRNRLNSKATHRSLGLQFQNYYVLALDNRSERRLDRVMSEDNWRDVKDRLSLLAGKGLLNLLVMTGIPVVYRSFSAVEATMDLTFWHEELDDDVHDHWSSRPHLAERMRLVMVLLNFVQENPNKRCNAVLLSGDVHVGALGQIWNERKKIGLTQLVSSGIVHPPPTAFAWAGIQIMTSDTPEALGDGEVVAEMLTPLGAPRYLRTRNFATLHVGTDEKLWLNWICEDEKLSPSFAVTNP